jgi:hypothetical protein
MILARADETEAERGSSFGRNARVSVPICDRVSGLSGGARERERERERERARELAIARFGIALLRVGSLPRQIYRDS